MGSSNTFSKALKHLKASRPSSLHEEVPTNNTQNLYRVEPMTFQETHPGVDAPDFNQDGDGSSGYTGTDTSGLFMPDGTIRVAEPPGDTSAILGPMASMWYAWGNFSTFGYIRQSDRKMVNLGRITGKLSDWDGVSNFTSYNTGFTIDQAVWFKDVEKYGGISNDPAEANYRAFYPGPPSNTPDQYGRYYCTTTGKPKNTRTGNNPPNRGPEGSGFPWGSGSNPNNRRRRGQGGRPGGSSGNRGGYGGGNFPGSGGPGGEGGEGGPPKPPKEPPIDPNTGEPTEPPTPEELAAAAKYVEYLAQKSVNDPGSLTNTERERLQAYSGENSVFKSTVDNVLSNLNLTPAQYGKIATNIAGGTPFNPSLQAYGGSSPGLGGEIKLGQHGTGQQAAQGIKKSGFNPGSRQNVYGTKGVFLDPSASGTAADDFARVGAAAEAGGKTTTGRGALSRAADLKAGGQGAGKGVKIPVAYKPGTGSRMNIPGTKYAEVGVDASKATKGARLAQNAITKYPNSVKAQQLITKGATTATSKGAARTVARTLGRAVPFAGAAISVADAGYRASQGDFLGAAMSGLTAVPGPVGWIALAGQIATDAAGITGGTYQKDPTYNTSTSGRGAGRKAFVKEENEYSSYQEYVDKAKEVIDRDKVKLGKDEDLLNVLKSELGLHDKLSDKDKEYLVDIFDNSEDLNPEEVTSFLNKIIKKLSSDEKKVSKSSLPRLPKRTNKVSSVDESHTLDVIKNVKKPVVIEEKKEKVKRRPRVIGSEPRTLNTSLMKQAEVPASFKKPEERMWGKYEREQNARASQDRKNVVLDHLGNADQAWEYLLDRNAGKRSFAGYFEKDGTPRTIFTDGKVKTVTREEKVGSDTLIFFTDEEGKKGSILQSEYNELQDQAHTQQMFAEYEATVAAAEEKNSFDVIAHKLELKAEKNPTNDKIQSMLSSYRALSHLRKEDKKQEAHFTSWKSSIDGTITSNFQSWVDSVGQETADAVTKMALTEKMSSSNLFGATLPATGDYDHIDMTFDSTYLDPDNDDIVNGAGSGSGYKGGFPVADGEQDVIQLTGHGEYSASAYTTDQDLTYVDTLSVTAIAGNGSNGGLTPINGLDVYFIGDEDFAGPFNVAPASQSSYANSQITIPENMRTKNVSIYLYSNTSEYVNGMNFSGRHFGNQTFNVPGLDFTTIRNLFAYDDPGEENGEDFLSFYFTKRDRNNSAHMKSLGHYYWYNVQAQRLGLVDTERTGSEGGWWWAQWPSPPVNPSRTFGDSGNNYVGGPEDEDYIKIGEMIWDQFFGTKLWGISNISFKRKAPASVYVPLDSPEAINFMRTAPEMKGLTPAQRLKKLKEMLAAGNEYLIKMLGVSGSTATPGPDEVAQGLPYTDEDDAFDNPYYDEPFKDPGDLDDSDDESTWDYAKGDGDTEVAGTNWDLYNWMNKTYGLPAAEWKKNNPTKPDASNPHLPAGSYVPKASKKQKTVVAHHEPKGKYLVDSKTFKKKSFSNWYSSMESEISDKVVEDTKKLIEGMTTGSLFNAPLPPAGDTDIVDKQTVFATHDGQNEALVNGEIVLTDDGDNDIADGEHTAFRQSWLFADASESSHIQITISKGGGTSNWTDRGTKQWDDHVSFSISDADNFDAPYYYTDNLSSGTHMIPLPGNYKRAFIYVSQFAKLSTSESPGATGTLRIKHVSLKRKTPVSVFVPLDSPEAVNFMRTNPLMQGLTPAERLMRLKRMLAAGNKYLFQQLGYKGSSATPGDMAQGLPYTDLDDAFDDPYYKGPPPDLDDDSDFDPDDFEYASADWPKGRPGGPPVQAPWNKGWPTAPGGRPYQGPPGTPGGKYPMAKGRKGPRTA